MALFLISSTSISATRAAEPVILNLWEGRAPGETAEPRKDTVMAKKPGENPPTLRLTDVSRPQITVYRPDKANNLGAAIVVAPGGGFHHLAYDKEGTEPAEWLASLGITGIVLKYRCPTKADAATRHIKPLQDAQRAMSLVRSHSQEWGIDPQQVGIMGFSAGGHLAARLALHEGSREYPAGDPIDQLDWHPAFTVLIYPAFLLNEQQDGLDTTAFHIQRTSPPTFMAYSYDDKHPSPGALHLAIAMKAGGVSCELHQYANGGHAYGMRPVASSSPQWPAITWPARLEDWLRNRGTIPM